MSPWTNKEKNTVYLVEPSKVKLEFELSRIFLCLIWGADQAGPKIGVDMQSHPHHDQIVSLKLVVYIKRTLDVRFAVVRVPLQLSGPFGIRIGHCCSLRKCRVCGPAFRPSPPHPPALAGACCAAARCIGNLAINSMEVNFRSRIFCDNLGAKTTCLETSLKSLESNCTIIV